MVIMPKVGVLVAALGGVSAVGALLLYYRRRAVAKPRAPRRNRIVLFGDR